MGYFDRALQNRPSTGEVAVEGGYAAVAERAWTNSPDALRGRLKVLARLNHPNLVKIQRLRTGWTVGLAGDGVSRRVESVRSDPCGRIRASRGPGPDPEDLRCAAVRPRLGRRAPTTSSLRLELPDRPGRCGEPRLFRPRQADRRPLCAGLPHRRPRSPSAPFSYMAPEQLERPLERRFTWSEKPTRWGSSFFRKSSPARIPMGRDDPPSDAHGRKGSRVLDAVLRALARGARIDATSAPPRSRGPTWSRWIVTNGWRKAPNPLAFRAWP